MTIINGYCTRAELMRELMNADNAQDPNALDDQVMDDIIQDASRAVDHWCDRQFYASAETLYLDVPSGRDLWFGRDVLAVQAASNGDGSLIASGQYYLWPRNAQSYAKIVLNQSASVGWIGSTGGDTEGAIAIAASLGYVDRAASAASDPEYGLQVISNTHRAALIKSAMLYRARFPSSVEMRVQKDSDWQALVEGYRRYGP